eukprot:gnl/MRDRNA2_/MRDRNA2_99543_c0_seq1.p1 gnl/MRDRNA2_/MRDRNA2_99543_c0~~gnl/MRDRNA2_/MRDRNA2_99543_c0_seq1.p1  ORF type:complete len:481 (-),score=95.78 gnl/MRDRNA2_/MRDRNA2_99543_c0_seq1:37-1413(-)
MDNNESLIERIRSWRKRPSVLAPVCLAILGIVLASYRRAKKQTRRLILPIALSELMNMLEEKSVDILEYSDGGQLFARRAAEATSIGLAQWYTTQLVPGAEDAVFTLVRQVVPSFRYVKPQVGVSRVAPMIFPFVFLYIWYRVVKSIISKDEKYEAPKRRQLIKETIRFDDVVCRSKVELSEIVEFLNKPQKFQKAGARMPRGALLVGPSGTGKTLLARAVAGEAHCPFISASASEFVEVYVGRGAARVRDLFKQARSIAPSVLFFDELDALGSRTARGEGRGSHEEYVQTINQLLTELDGFHGHGDRLVVLAATNRYEAVDPALLRPGRFDRHVIVALPDEDDRLQILQIHASKAPMASDLVEDMGVLHSIACNTDGFSGADLANVINDAVFLAMRHKRSQVIDEDIYEAVERNRAMRTRAQNGSSSSSVYPGTGRFPKLRFSVPLGGSSGLQGATL